MRKIMLLFFFMCSLAELHAVITPADQLKNLQAKIDELERGILATREQNQSYSTELQKLNKLFQLQSLEIRMRQSELSEMEEKLKKTEDQSQKLLLLIEDKKSKLRENLSQLPAFAYSNPVTQMIGNEKTMQIMHKNLINQWVSKEKDEITTLKNLEIKLNELNEQTRDEKIRIQAHVEDLKEKQAILDLNRINVRKRPIQNKKIFAEQVKELQNLKTSEHEVESMMNSLSGETNIIAKTVTPIEKKMEYNFLNRKGELRLPVVGAVINEFGKKYDPKTNLYTFHKGIEISSSPSSSVKAVFPGKVVFAGKLGGYRQLIIIDHGKQFYSLTGNLGEILKKEGEWVEEGHAIANTSADQTPLYFEIRQRHIAINPIPWFKDLKLLARRIMN